MLLSDRDLLILAAYLLLVVAVASLAHRDAVRDLMRVEKVSAPKDPFKGRWYQHLWQWFDQNVLKVLRPPPPDPKPTGDYEIKYDFEKRYALNKIPSFKVKLTNLTSDKIVKILWDHSTINLVIPGPPKDKKQNLVCLAPVKIVDAIQLQTEAKDKNYITKALPPKAKSSAPTSVPPGVPEVEREATAEKTLQDKDGMVTPTTIFKVTPPGPRTRLADRLQYKAFMNRAPERKKGKVYEPWYEFSLRLAVQVGSEPIRYEEPKFRVRLYRQFYSLFLEDKLKNWA